MTPSRRVGRAICTLREEMYSPFLAAGFFGKIAGMKNINRFVRSLGARLIAAAILLPSALFAETRTEKIRAKLASPDRDYVFVAMHRGDWRNFPENSKGAIISAINIGADIVELDVQMTKDGKFILNHDESLDRTTNAKGKVSDYTLAELKKFRMKKDGKLTGYKILSLEEALELTRGKIIVNIDKFVKHPKEILDAVKAAGATTEVLVKSEHTVEEAKELFGEHWADVESGKLLFMPITRFDLKRDKDVKAPRILETWLSVEPRACSMYEVCINKAAQEKILKKVPAGKGAPRLWLNTMWDNLSAGHGDIKALEDPEAHWGWALRQGATMLQTDCGAELILYLQRKGRRNL